MNDMTHYLARTFRTYGALLFLLVTAPAGAAQLESAGTRLLVQDGEVILFRGVTPLMKLDEIRFDYAAPTGWVIESADTDRIVVRMDYPPVVDHGHAASDTAARSARLEIERLDGGFRLHAAPTWADRVSLEMPHLGDAIFGLSSPLQPDNRHAPDLRGAEIHVDVVNEGGNLAENYASAFSAFYMSSHGYGAFFDTFATGRYRFAVNGRNQVHHDTGSLDWFLFPGTDGAAIHRAYFGHIGSPRALPPWALGPVAWRDHNDNAAQILDDIAQFAERQLPLTAWFVDRPYSDGAHAWSHMNFNADFADPCHWIDGIRAGGLEFMTWTSTAFFGDTPLPRHLAGRLTYADLSDPATWSAYQERLALQHACGVRGHKMDRADEHFPREEEWADASVTASERRNRYAYLFTKIHDEALDRAWGDDRFSFARAAIHRTQPRLGAVWGGDPRSNWAGMAGNLANAIRAGFMGFPVWGSDVGGYLGEGWIDPELYLRWLQFGVFSGFLEIKLDGAGGEGRDRMPWRYDPAFEARFRKLLQVRMDLLPTLHSLANTAAVNGVLMQPMAYRHPDDPETHSIWDQFYLGDALLVAPLVTPGGSRQVYLPEGRWRAWPGFPMEAPKHAIAGASRQDLRASLDELPLYVRENSLLVLGEVAPGNTIAWREAQPHLRLLVIPGRPGESNVFDYVDTFDGNLVKALGLAHTANGIELEGPALGVDLAVTVYLDNGIVTRNVPAGHAIEISLDY